MLELAPEELVVDIVVKLDLGWLDDGAEQPRAAIRRGLLQIRVPPFTSSPSSVVVHSALRKSSMAV